MGAPAVATAGAIRRRRTQAVVLGLVMFLASAAATMALGILDASSQPFERAFAQANGASSVDEITIL